MNSGAARRDAWPDVESWWRGWNRGLPEFWREVQVKLIPEEAAGGGVGARFADGGVEESGKQGQGGDNSRAEGVEPVDEFAPGAEVAEGMPGGVEGVHRNEDAPRAGSVGAWSVSRIGVALGWGGDDESLMKVATSFDGQRVIAEGKFGRAAELCTFTAFEAEIGGTPGRDRETGQDSIPCDEDGFEGWFGGVFMERDEFVVCLGGEAERTENAEQNFGSGIALFARHIGVRGLDAMSGSDAAERVEMVHVAS